MVLLTRPMIAAAAGVAGLATLFGCLDLSCETWTGGDSGNCVVVDSLEDDLASAVQLRAKVGKAEAEQGSGETVKFMKNDEVLQKLPMAAPGVPEHLKGVYWLDQAGTWGNTSTLFGSAPDLCFSLGAATEPWKDHKITVSTTGPGWQWFNSVLGYMFFRVLSVYQLKYLMTFNENNTQAFIIPIIRLYPLPGFFKFPIWLVHFKADFQSNPVFCKELTKDATTDQIKACASVKRESTVLGSNIGTYYMHKIGDKDHKPIEPAYSMYLKHANEVSQPDPTSAVKYLGKKLVGPYMEKGTSFVGGNGNYCTFPPSMVADVPKKLMQILWSM